MTALVLALLPAVAMAQTATFTIDNHTFTFDIAPEHEQGYQRSDWPHWNTRVGGQCFNVRDKVLVEETYVAVVIEPASGGRCRITNGWWIDPYTGLEFGDSGQEQVDHVVPLKEAHDSGGHAWTRDRRRAYANYLDYSWHLIAVQGSENQSKSDDDPADYLPPNTAFRCQYLEAWIRIKDEWGLNMDQREADAITAALGGC